MPKLSKKNRVSKKKSKKNNKNRNRNKTLKGDANNNVNQSVPVWKLGDHVKPPGMPEDQWYVLTEKKGETWKAVHKSGRYYDFIPATNKNTWCHRKKPEEGEEVDPFPCPKIAVETSNDKKRSHNSNAQSHLRRSTRQRKK